MAFYVAYANYVVYFSDPTEYQFAVAVANNNLLEVPPSTAAAMFGFVDGVHYNTGGALHPDKGMYGVSPYGLGLPDPPGVEVLHPAPSGKFLQFSVAGVIVPGQVGNPDSGFGPDLHLIWSASIVRAGGQGALNKPERAPLARARFFTGFEINFFAGAGRNLRDRDASRTLDGVGYGLRNSANQTKTFSLTEFSSLVPGNNWESWERFYIRPRVVGGGDIDVWRSEGAPSSNSGIQLRLKTDLSFDIYNVTSFSVFNLIENTTPVLALNQWAKIDVIIQYNNPGRGNIDGRFRLFINGIAVSDFTVLPGSAGIGAASQTHAASKIGTATVGANTWEIDLDDWTNKEIPNILGVESLNSVDWILGTHIKRLFVNGGTNTNWSGPIQATNQMPNPENSALLSISTTALAVTEGITELGLVPYTIGTIFSTNAFLITSYSRLASGSVDGQLGYRFAGGAAVLSTIVEDTIRRANSVIYPGSGVDILVDPLTVVPFSVIYQKANNVVSTELLALQGEVEFVGVWGLEDDPNTIPLPRLSITHNAWYPTIANAFLGPPSDGPVSAVGGTYVGNGTSNTIPLPLPAHMIWIRSLSATNEGAKWWGTGLGGHFDGDRSVNPQSVIRADFDSTTGISSFTVIGNSANINQSGVTYQYIAFCDPGFQFNLCGTLMHAAAVTNASNLLFDSNFVPAAAFFQPESLDTTGTVFLSYKGPGIGGTNVRVISGTNLANGATLNTGEVVSGSDLHTQNPNNQIIYSLWKTSNNCASEMLQIFSYVGDGTGNRIINFPNLTGRCGLLICIQPDAVASMITRDPSDSGTTSRNAATNGAVANGIIDVDTPDQFTVGSTLNASGVTYSVFIILGDTLGMNNGAFFPFSCNPNGLTGDPEPPLPGIIVLTQGGLVFNGAIALSLLQDVGGIYTIIPGKTDDTLYDRQPGQTTVDVAIPNPKWKTGYIGG